MNCIIPQILTFGIFLMIVGGCNRKQVRESRYCEKEKDLIDCDFCPSANWDFTLDMNAFYKSIAEQTNTDTCKGFILVNTKVALPSGDSISIYNSVEYRQCDCCPQNPPGIPLPKTRIEILSNDSTLVESELVSKDSLLYKLIENSDRWYHPREWFINYQLLWGEGVSKEVLRDHVLVIIDSYFELLKMNETWMGEDFCHSADSIPNDGFPRFILKTPGYMLPPSPPPPIPDSLKVNDSL